MDQTDHPDEIGAEEADVLRRSRGITSRFFQPEINKRLQDKLAERAMPSRFILSFPRSGSGFLRNLMAKVVLHREGYPVFDAGRRGTRETDGRRVQEITFTDPAFAPVIIDRVFPDVYKYTGDEIAAFDDRFVVAGVRWIKTHTEVPEGLGPFVFLFRDPVVACSSFFNLVASPDIVEKAISGELLTLFRRSVEMYLDAYERLARSALDGCARGDCHLISLKRLETGDFGQIADWLAAVGEPFEMDTLGRIVEATPKFSRFDHRLLDLWDDALHRRAAQAKSAYAQLEAHPNSLQSTGPNKESTA